MKREPMTAIEFRFLTGRYHATPWDHQVNEGIVEWPPSPWRILRTMIATWYTKAYKSIDKNALSSLIQKLTPLPSYYLPPATVSHTRHYMPLYRSAINGKTTKIFDTFIHVGDSPVIIKWDGTQIDDLESDALQTLCEHIGYLGRAESWVEGRVIEHWDGVINCYPLTRTIDTSATSNLEIVPVLAPMVPLEYSSWRESMREDLENFRLEELREKAREKEKDPSKVKLSDKDLRKIESVLPDDIFEALQMDTGHLRSDGWSQPPGSRWVEYVRPRNCFHVIPQRVTRRETRLLPTVVRYAVASQAPPRLTDAVALADRIHTALVSLSDGMEIFSGCDSEGNPITGHRHAYILCESNQCLGKGHRGEITHVTIFSPSGFDKEARSALSRLRKVWGHGGHDIQLVILGIGQPSDFGGANTGRGECPLLAESDAWISRTPFVPTLHPKFTRKGVPKLDERGIHRGSPEYDLRRLLQAVGLPEPIEVKSVDSTDLGGRRTSWLQFRTIRKGGGRHSSSRGYGFIIRFPHPVRGPISVGYGSHYGLGLFVPK